MIAARAQTARAGGTPAARRHARPDATAAAAPMPGMPGLPPACGLPPPSSFPYGMYGAGSGCSPACGPYGPAGGAFGGMGAAPYAGCGGAFGGMCGGCAGCGFESCGLGGQYVPSPGIPPPSSPGLAMPGGCGLGGGFGGPGICMPDGGYLPTFSAPGADVAGCGGGTASSAEASATDAQQAQDSSWPSPRASPRAGATANAAALARAAARKTGRSRACRTLDGRAAMAREVEAAGVISRAAGGSRSPRRSCGSVAESAGEASTDSGDEAWLTCRLRTLKQKV